MSYIIACHVHDSYSGCSFVPVRVAQTKSGTKAHAHIVGSLWVDPF